MKIIINTPIINIPAGVANHYLGLKEFFSKKIIYNQYIPGASIKQKYGIIIYCCLIPILKVSDTLKFIFLIIVNNKPIILLNPSFSKSALKRDAFFTQIAKFFGCKVAVFMHGWDKVYLKKVFEKEELLSNAWYKVDAFFVLASEFKDYLLLLNIQAPIHFTTTKVNDELIEGMPQKRITELNTILFLARIEKTKGIYTAIETFEILSKKYPDIQLRIVGRGSLLNEVIEYTKNKNIKNIIFRGPLAGNELKQEFIKADIYILPTHGEGMPTSVLEAMAFGLPIVTRPVGGLNDFFENDKMGYMIESLDPNDFAEKIELLMIDVNKADQISQYNAKYAKEHFMASKIAPVIETTLINI